MSRGLRNNNPGNIRNSGSQRRYRGEKSPSTDPEFRQFIALKWGYRAIFVVLYTYAVRHQLHTPRGWIERWAPPCENNTEAYIEFVCHTADVDPDEPLSPLDPKRMIPFAAALSKIENGSEAPMDELLAGWNLFFCDFGPKSTKNR